MTLSDLGWCESCAADLETVHGCDHWTLCEACAEQRRCAECRADAADDGGLR